MDLANKLKEFAHLIGKIPDEKLAEMAGLTLDELATAKAALAAEAEKAKEPVTTPAGRDAFAEAIGEKAAALVETLKPNGAERLSLKALSEELSITKYRLSELEDSHRNLASAHSDLRSEVAVMAAELRILRNGGNLLPEPKKEAQEEPQKAPAELPSGKAVKVIKNKTIIGYQGKRTSLNYGDILTGEEAAWILKNHPGLVKVYG